MTALYAAQCLHAGVLILCERVEWNTAVRRVVPFQKDKPLCAAQELDDGANVPTWITFCNDASEGG